MNVSGLPAGVEPFVRELTDEQQMWLLSRYHRRSRSTGAMVALAVILPIQHFFLGKWVTGVIFWLTGFGLGIWYLAEWFLTPGRVRAYNEVLVLQMILGLKYVDPDDEMDRAEQDVSVP